MKGRSINERLDRLLEGFMIQYMTLVQFLLQSISKTIIGLNYGPSWIKTCHSDPKGKIMSNGEISAQRLQKIEKKSMRNSLTKLFNNTMIYIHINFLMHPSEELYKNMNKNTCMYMEQQTEEDIFIIQEEGGLKPFLFSKRSLQSFNWISEIVISPYVQLKVTHTQPA